MLAASRFVVGSSSASTPPRLTCTFPTSTRTWRSVLVSQHHVDGRHVADVWNQLDTQCQPCQLQELGCVTASTHHNFGSQPQLTQKESASAKRIIKEHRTRCPALHRPPQWRQQRFSIPTWLHCLGEARKPDKRTLSQGLLSFVWCISLDKTEKGVRSRFRQMGGIWNFMRDLGHRSGRRLLLTGGAIPLRCGLEAQRQTRISMGTAAS